MTLRVAHVNVAKAYRGGERQTELLIRELANLGVEQRLVARKGAPLGKRFTGLDLEIVEVSGLFWSVARATCGVDIVHVHEGRSVYGALVRSIVSQTPYIVTRRVDNPIGDHWFAHRAFRRAKFVVGVAPQIAEIVRRYDPGIESRVIHSSASNLPVDRQTADELRRSFRGQFVVGHVGALDNAQKAQDLIIEVARRLKDSHPGFRFVLVGGGDDEEMLKRAARGLPNVIFTGFVENVGDYLAAFDLFILPSRREGIGSILLDAMEQGLAIVASRVGGVPEIVHHERNGLLIDAERPDQLQDAICALAASPEMRKTMGEIGRETARRYTADVMASKYLALYKTALGQSE